MTMRAALGNAGRAVQNSGFAIRVESWVSTAVVALARTVVRIHADPSGAHLLLAAPGRGNVGDQAMFEAFVDNVSGPVTVIVRRQGDLLAIPPARTADVRVVVLPNILYGPPMHHLRDVVRLLPLMRGSRSLSVVGADIMDGAYNNLASVRRFRIPRLAARLGLDTRILGFSWNDHPTREASAAMVAASAVTTLLPREPKSAERLLGDGAHQVTTVADLAFLVRPSGALAGPLDRWITDQRAGGRRLVIINANHGLQRYTDQVDALARLILKGVEQDTSFILLPHDSRGRESDEVLAGRIWDAVHRHGHVHLVPNILLPGEVATLASRVDFAITGRMHLAILASTVGTPAIALSYQGKIEGLYAKLGLRCFVEPDAHLATNIWRQFVEVGDDLEAVRRTLQTNVGELKTLATGNVRGLGLA